MTTLNWEIIVLDKQNLLPDTELVIYINDERDNELLCIDQYVDSVQERLELQELFKTIMKDNKIAFLNFQHPIFSEAAKIKIKYSPDKPIEGIIL